MIKSRIVSNLKSLDPIEVLFHSSLSFQQKDDKLGKVWSVLLGIVTKPIQSLKPIKDHFGSF